MFTVGDTLNCSYRALWEEISDLHPLRVMRELGLQLFHQAPSVRAQVWIVLQVSSVHFSHSIMSESLRPDGLQHARLPSPSPTPGAYSNSCPPVGDAIQQSHPLLLVLLPPSIFPRIKAFLNESFLRIRLPNYWSFSFSISPSSEYSGLIFFRMDWLDPLAVQGTLKSLLQHHNSKASILWCSVSFIVQLSHPYMTSGKTIALTR